jgi:hypothetical protein
VRSDNAEKIASSSSSEYLTMWFSIGANALLCQAFDPAAALRIIGS